MDDLLSTQQVAEILGLHRTTVLNLVQDGKIEARVYRYANTRPTIRVPRQAVLAFMDQYMDPPVEPPGTEPSRG